MDAIWGIWNLVSSVFDGDGVTACRVWDVRHRVRSIPVVPNVGFLWLSLWILAVGETNTSLSLVASAACTNPANPGTTV